MFIPEKEKRIESAASDTKHTYRYLDTVRSFYLELIDYDGNLLENHTYKLKVSGILYEGDCAQPIDIDLPIDADHGTLQVFNEDGVEIENSTLDFDELDPVVEKSESITGVQARLNNLGYFAGSIDNDLGEMTQDAVRRFQMDNGLQVTGNPDDIRDKLIEKYGC